MSGLTDAYAPVYVTQHTNELHDGDGVEEVKAGKTLLRDRGAALVTARRYWEYRSSTFKTRFTSTVK